MRTAAKTFSNTVPVVFVSAAGGAPRNLNNSVRFLHDGCPKNALASRFSCPPRASRDRAQSQSPRDAMKFDGKSRTSRHIRAVIVIHRRVFSRERKSVLARAHIYFSLQSRQHSARRAFCNRNIRAATETLPGFNCSRKTETEKESRSKLIHVGARETARDRTPGAPQCKFIADNALRISVTT